jgi:hypothetical protein
VEAPKNFGRIFILTDFVGFLFKKNPKYSNISLWTAAHPQLHYGIRHNAGVALWNDMIDPDKQCERKSDTFPRVERQFD